jgi:hypothetical protein
MTFRFNHKGSKDRIGYWFAGSADNSWKADHKKCDEFMDKLGRGGSEFARRWSMATTLAHPTRFASDNSIACATLWAANPRRVDDYEGMMEPKIADYLTSIATLIVIATYDFPDLVSLGCNLSRTPNIDTFRAGVFEFVVPILNKTKDGNLPPSSYRS